MNTIEKSLLYAEAPGWSAALLSGLRSILPMLQDIANTADAAATIDPRSFEAMRSIGLLSAPLPAAHGGCGLAGPEHADDLFDCLRLVGSADLVLGRLFEGHVNAIALVERYGARTQAGDLALAVRDGALSAVWAADGAQPLVAERRDGGGVRLSGRKVLASGAGLVTRPLVTAATAEGPLLLLLDLSAGARTELGGWTAQGMRATATGTIDLDGLMLGQDAVIGEPGDVMRQPVFSGGAWRFCAVHLGAAEQLVDQMRAHLVSRARDGDPYQVQRIAGCAAAVGSAGFWIREAARRLADDSLDASDTVAFVNLTRMVTERAALDVLEAVHRGVGLAAFMRPHPIERISRDLATYLRQPVPDLAMADAGRAVLSSPRATGDLVDEAMTIGEFLAAMHSMPVTTPEAFTGGAPLVVLSPHPDDESLGLGGLIAAACAAGGEVRIVVLSDGAASHRHSASHPPAKLAALRRQEAREAAAILGVPADGLTHLDLPDAAVPHAGPAFDAAVGRIASIVADAHAPKLLVSWGHDPHCDHEAADAMARAVRGKLPDLSVWSYPIWGRHLDPATPIEAPMPAGYRLDVTPWLDRKHRAIAAHASQMTDLIADDPDGFRFTPAQLAPFLTPQEFVFALPR